LASSARLPSGRFPYQVDFRSWPCAHPRGSRPSSGLVSPAVAEAPAFVPRRPPLRFLAPSPLPVPAVRVPVAHSLRPLSGSCAVGHLVAGFHARAVPPAPFLTTLTTCSVRGPVGSFTHSRPWGSGSLYSTRASPCEGWVSSATASRSGLAPAGRRRSALASQVGRRGPVRRVRPSLRHLARIRRSVRDAGPTPAPSPSIRRGLRPLLLRGPGVALASPWSLPIGVGPVQLRGALRSRCAPGPRVSRLACPVTSSGLPPVASVVRPRGVVRPSHRVSPAPRTRFVL